MQRFLPKSLLKLIPLCITLLLVFVLQAPAQAQSATSQSTEAPAEPKIVDPYGRSTPRGAVQGYLAAVGSGDYEKAARFLDMSDQPLGDRKKLGIERAEQLKMVLDRNGVIFDVNTLSNVPNGETDDELDVNTDKVGVLDRSNRKIPLLVERVDGGDNGQIWLFSTTSLLRVPFLIQVTDEGVVDRILPEGLKAFKIGSVSVGHWLVIIVVGVISLIAGYFISLMVIGLLRKFLTRRSNIPGSGALAGMVVPLGVLIAISIYRGAILSLGVDVVARETIDRVGVTLGWIAIAWLATRFVDGVAAVARYSTAQTDQYSSSVAVIGLVRRLVKAAIIAIAAIAILDVAGVDVTTGLAALGIGGLALALGAQRTIENLVGSITVVADKPVRVGDYCKFGEATGTVEDIGIRSTKIRTLDRTIVTVPNGAFAAMQIENYAMRDEIKFETVLNMRYESTPDQMRYLLVEIRSLLYSHDHVNNDPARVRFVSLGSHSLDIEIFCYIKTQVYNEFLEIQEDLLLRIMDVVKSSGTDFAFPSQTLYLGRDEKPSEADAKKIGNQMKKLAREGSLSLPRFNEQKIAELDGSIEFPKA